MVKGGEKGERKKTEDVELHCFPCALQLSAAMCPRYTRQNKRNLRSMVDKSGADIVAIWGKKRGKRKNGKGWRSVCIVIISLLRGRARSHRFGGCHHLPQLSNARIRP